MNAFSVAFGGKADMARAMQNARFWQLRRKPISDVGNGFEANAKLGLHK